MNAEQFSAGQHYAIRRHVKWGEMDAFAHVNNTVYFRWAEEVRIAHFESLGLMAHLAEHQVGPILASIDCRFKLPLTYPDEVLIGSTISDLQEDRFVMHHQIFSLRHQTIAGQGKGLVVCFDYARGCKASVPTAVSKSIEALVSTSQ